MRRIVLTFGLIAGAILGAMMLISHLFWDQIGFDRAEIIGYTTMVLAFLMVFFGVKSYRDNVAGGTLGFGRAFLAGLLITAVATLCYVAVWEFVYYQLAPDFGDKYAAYTLERAKSSGATEAQIAEQMKQMEGFKELYKNPLVNIAFTFLEPLPVGLVFSLVTAAILRRRPGGKGAPKADPEAQEGTAPG